MSSVEGGLEELREPSGDLGVELCELPLRVL